ncbi:MAG: hypothetical protein ACF8R7_13540 [Phycisphaerales bacterium JB039]
MTVLPKSLLGRIEFLEYHLPIWLNDPTAIGLSLTAVTELQGLTTAARSAYTTQQTARQNAIASTGAFHIATDDMSVAASAAIAAIKAYAKTTGDPNVYTLAEIPAPAAPQPAPLPAAPTQITTGLDPSGAVTLAWKITQPAPGAEIVTLVHRRLGSTGAFSLLAVTGDKHYTDATVPPGTQQVGYLLQARRGEDLGPYSTAINVFLGVPENGEQGQLSIAA